MADGRRRLLRPTAHVTLATTASTVLIHLPVFLLGGLAVLIREDIASFDEARLGAAVSVFFGASALASVVGGRLSEARGPRLGMIAAALLSAGALLALAATSSLAGVFVASAFGGAANGIGQPASNLGLARGIRRARQGFAFGIKQASVPLASLLTGLSIPLIGLTLGWRWTFAVAVLLAVAVIALVPRRFAPAAQRATGTGIATDAPRPALLLLATGAGLGSAAANSLAAFTVLTLVAAGITAGPAGYLLALGSAAGVTARVLTGWRADRRGHAHLPVVARMLAIGTLGYLLLAVGDLHPALLVVGVVTAFAAGWGWPGLLAFAVVRLHPGAPGLASGIVLAGGTAGAVVGPLLFGVVARVGSFSWAWLTAAALSLAGAALVWTGRRTVRAAVAGGRMQKPPGAPTPPT